MYLGCLVTHSASPSPEEIASVNTAGVTDDIVQEALNQVMTNYSKLGASDQVAKGVDLLAQLNAELARPVVRFAPRCVKPCCSA